MDEHVDLTWPWCLGVFDEESCRFFLHEIGSRLVPRYPFSFGMEEVYGMILERYGFEGTSDVTGLLQELLEDDQNARGLGDDGDVWRSWRHGWRHRNDDVRSPFIPRYGPLVLRQSTPPRIRLLKAGNFIGRYATRNTAAREESQTNIRGPRTLNPGSSRKAVVGNSPNRLIAAADLCSRNRSQTLDAEYSCNPEKAGSRTLDKNDEYQMVGHKRGSSTTDTNLPLYTLSGTPENSRTRFALLRGGDRADESRVFAGTETVQNLSSGQLNPEIKSRSEEVIVPTARGVSGVPKLYTSEDLADLHRWSALHVTSNIETGARRRKSVRNSESRGEDTVEGVASVTASPTFAKQQSASTLEDERRAKNRQARLIDGTIFTSRTQRSKAAGVASQTLSCVSAVTNKRLSARLSSSLSKRRDSLRSTWAREVRHLFRRDKSDLPDNSNFRHCSVPGPAQGSHCRHSSSMLAVTDKQQPLPKDVVRQSRISLGLDGTADRSPSVSALNLNKPLPLSPDDIVRSMSSRSQLTSSQSLDNNSNLPSTTSTTSSLSRTSSRKDFRGATRDLLQSEMLANHELPPIDEVDTSKEHVDPEKSLVLPPSPSCYKDLAQGNPYFDKTSSQSRSPNRPPPLDLTHVKYNTQTHILGPSTTQILDSDDTTSLQQVQPESYFPSLPWSRSDRSNQNTANEQCDRGRTRPAPLSPTHFQKENLPPKTPTKRSRSPIKRFLGLTKSNSTNQLDDSHPNKTVPPTTPGSSKIDSLKKWGDKLRYGFLTPDQEQLRQEELIEAHNNNSASSTPQSSFPISLEPPVQAKIQSEVELIVTVTANRYLLHEAYAGRISPESVAKIKELWEKLNRPQVVEFHYDQLTQHNLIMANLDRVRLHGDASQDAIAINSTMRGWKTMAREMSIRTFCSPDSVIRKHLHDAHRVLELLGAPLVTFLAYEDMQLKTLAKINQRQKERLDRRAGSAGRNASTTSTSSNLVGAISHRRNVSEGSYQQRHDYSDYPITALQMDKISLSPSPTPISRTKVRKATGGEGAIMSLPTNLERSRDAYAANMRAVKMGKSVKEI